MKGSPLVFWDYVKQALQCLGWNIYILVSMVSGVPYTAPKNILLFPVAAVSATAGFVLGRYPWNGRETWKKIKRFGFGAAYLAFMFCYYTFYHRVAFWRYFYAMMLVSIPLLTLVISGFNLESVLPANKRRFATACLVLFLLGSTGIMLRVKEYPQQKDMYQAALWMRDHLPPNARIGAFNAGINSYWSERQVVNLDGVNNHGIFDALKQKQLWNYIETQNIQYICDFDSAIDLYFRIFDSHFDKSRLAALESVSLSEGKDSLTVYRVVSGGRKE
jgi:hypothetical protein